MGLKVIAASPVHGRVSYLVPLFDQRTAALVALLDGHSITGYRTAAVSALAVDELAPEGPLDVAVIGSGFEARHHLRALAAVRPLRRARVFSPRATSRTAYVDALADVAVVEPAESAEAAVAGAGVVCAARSRDESPTLRGEWLAPGVTVVSIGSTLPEQREVDVMVLERTDLLVADVVQEVLEETGDRELERPGAEPRGGPRGPGRRRGAGAAVLPAELLPRDRAGGLRLHPRGVRRDRPGGHPVPVGLQLAHPPLRHPRAPHPTAQYYGPVVPRVMRLLQEGRFDGVTETYWQLHPARKVEQGLAAQLNGGAFINRQAWKFQGWLQGYNGGPLRQPTQRIHDAQMHALRKGLVDAGLEPSTDPLRDFFVGRNPG